MTDERKVFTTISAALDAIEQTKVCADLAQMNNHINTLRKIETTFDLMADLASNMSDEAAFAHEKRLDAIADHLKEWVVELRESLDKLKYDLAVNTSDSIERRDNGDTVQ